MGKGKQGAQASVAIVAIVLIIVLLFMGPLKNVIGGGWWNPSGPGGISGKSGITLRVWFTDGTYTDATPGLNGLSLLPLSITWSPGPGVVKTIQSIGVNMMACLVGQNIGAWSSTVSIAIEIHGSTGDKLYSSTGYYQNNGTSWVSNTIHQIASTTVGGVALNQIVAQYSSASADFVLNIVSTLQMHVIVSGVDGIYNVTPEIATLTFHYNNDRLDSIDAWVNTSPLS